MTPFYVGRVLLGSELTNADPGTTVAIVGSMLYMERIKLRNGKWFRPEDESEGDLADEVKYVIVGLVDPLADLLSDPVDELAEELWRHNHPYVSREVPFDDVVGADEYREIARMVFKHFDHKIKGPVKV